jgi:hypothetical protein
MGFAFHRRESLDAAIAMAREHGEVARFLAGGTDLIIQIEALQAFPSLCCRRDPVTHSHKRPFGGTLSVCLGSRIC